MNEAHKDEKRPKAPPPPPIRDDDDGPGTPSTVMLKQRTLATALSRAIVISTVIGALAFVSNGLVGAMFSARYTLVPAPNTSNNFVYRLDRLTGGVQFCGQQQCVDVTHAEKMDK